ncbi:ThuA domain-containing protein [soil metagenome]
MTLKSLAYALAAATLIPTAALAADADQWLTLDGAPDLPGSGKKVVLISGDEEYRSEEAMPQLAKILSERHGFDTTVLFPINPESGLIDPNHGSNIPGLEALGDADLAIIQLRFRHLPDDQMKHIIDYTNSGKPIIGLRTSTHAFNFPGDSESPYAKYTWTSSDPKGGWGQQVLGDTWINHHGDHGTESTRGVINEDAKDHPILTGVDDLWGPTDVYGIQNLPDDATVLVHGQVIKGMKPEDAPVEGAKNDPMQPVVWIRENYQTETGNSSKIITSTFFSASEMENEDTRRLLVNSAYYATGLEDKITPDLDVAPVGDFQPSMFGFKDDKHWKEAALTPASFK